MKLNAAANDSATDFRAECTLSPFLTMDANASHDLIVVPYRAEWPEAYAREADLLTHVFRGTGAVFEHIGSTAVPGLGAKPIIDIMIGLHSLADAEHRLDDLSRLGYQYVPEYEGELPDRRYCRKPFHRPRTHHLHMVVAGSDLWVRALLFRNYLRAHPETATAYFELKRRLARESNATGVDYTQAKSPFVADVLRRARSGS